MCYRYEIYLVPGWVAQVLRIGYPPFTPLGTPLSKGLSWGKGLRKLARAYLFWSQFGGYRSNNWWLVLTTQYGHVMVMKEVE